MVTSKADVLVFFFPSLLLSPVLSSHLSLFCASLTICFSFTYPSSLLNHYFVSLCSPSFLSLLLCMFYTTLLSYSFFKFYSAVCFSVFSVVKDIVTIVIVSFCHRVPETHYENVNLQKEQKGRTELIIPRYHELVPKQEEKKVNMCLCWWVSVYCCMLGMDNNWERKA